MRRWEQILGREHPPPLERGTLSADFAEWFMGWPEGWTDVPGLSTKDRIKILGNGVVPLQAAVATRLLYERSERE